MRVPGTPQQSKREIDKQQAVRHLIHSAIRMFSQQENVFAIHLLIHSADKMLLDMGRKMNIPLDATFEKIVRKEYQGNFWSKHRALYNYLKHADDDFDSKLLLGGKEVLSNAILLFLCIYHYNQLFKTKSVHMQFFERFAFTLMPNVLTTETEDEIKFKNAFESLSNITPDIFFDYMLKNIGQYFPKYNYEKSEDLRDNLAFYQTRFSDLR